MRAAPALLLAVIGLAACASVDPAPPPAPEGPSTFGPGGLPLPDSETARYEGSLGMLPAGEAEFSFHREGDRYVTRATLATTGLVSLVYGVEIAAESVAGAEDKRGLRFSWSTGGGETEKQVEIRFDAAAGRVLSVVRKPGGIDSVTREDPEARDPLALVYALRRADLAPGRTFRAVVIAEWNLYLAEVRVEGVERLNVPAGAIDTLPVRVDIRKLVDGVPEEKRHAMGFWIATDVRRVPAKITYDTAYGRLRLELVSHEAR